MKLSESIDASRAGILHKEDWADRARHLERDLAATEREYDRLEAALEACQRERKEFMLEAQRKEAEANAMASKLARVRAACKEAADYHAGFEEDALPRDILAIIDSEEGT